MNKSKHNLRQVKIAKMPFSNNCFKRMGNYLKPITEHQTNIDGIMNA